MIFTLLTSSLAAAGFTGAVTIFGLSPGLSAVLLQVGKAVLWQGVAKLTAPGVPAEHVQANIAQAAAPRIRGYGTYLQGGVRALFESSGGMLHQILVMHHGEVSAVTGYLIDGEPVTLDGSGNVITGAPALYMSINAILSGDGGDYAPARAAFPTIWTTDHTLTGQATIYVRMVAPNINLLTKAFPRRENTLVQAIVQQSKVLDPRTGIIGYSDLTGPCVLDYMTHADGYRIPLAAVDQDSFAQFTDLCDQAVALKAGGTEKRYRVGGYYSLEDAPKDVMERLLATADAQIYMTPEGKAGIMGGEWLDPDVTITEDDILDLELSDGSDLFSDFNVLKGKFTSPDHRWQETECAELVDAVAQLTQPERVDTLVVDMCPSHSQMQRLMRAHRATRIREFVGTMRTNLVGMKARFPRGSGRHVIRVYCPSYDIDEVFEVTSHAYSVADRICIIGLASIANPYAWVAATDEGDPPPRLADLDRPVHVDAVPTGLTLTQEVIAVTSGQNAVRIVAIVDDPLQPSLQLRAEYRKLGDTVWQPMIAGVGDLQAYTGVLSDAATYQVRASWLGVDTYTAIVSTTTVANPVAPAAATGLSKAYAAPNVTLTWTNAVTGYYRTRIYRGTTSTFSAATLLATVAGIAGQVQTYQNAPGTGTWYFWVVTINASSIEQTAPTGPVSQTI